MQRVQRVVEASDIRTILQHVGNVSYSSSLEQHVVEEHDVFADDEVLVQ